MTSHPENILPWSWSTFSLNSILNSCEFELHMLAHRIVYVNAKRCSHLCSLQWWKKGGESFFEHGDFVDLSRLSSVIRFTIILVRLWVKHAVISGGCLPRVSENETEALATGTNVGLTKEGIPGWYSSIEVKQVFLQSRYSSWYSSLEDPLEAHIDDGS